MSAISRIMSSNATSDPVFSGGGRVRALDVRRSATARRMRLAVDPRDGAVRLTLPRRATLRIALAWAEGHRAWVERALAALPAPLPFAHGAAVPVEGVPLTIDWAPGHGRTVRIEGGRLLVGGPAEMLPRRLERWLRALAAERLGEETRGYATRAGVTVGRVSLGDPRARWGSCSGTGDIRYSWRLILAPPDVRRATVAHEVAHRLHMHHGPAFHAAVAAIYGREPVAERAWLKRHGAGLHWVGRGD